jgi:hypothetical protein
MMILLIPFIKMLIFILSLCDSLELNFIPSTKTPPSSRYNSFLDYLKPRSSLILFGGSQGTLLCNDIWEFSLQSMTWQEIIPLSREVPGIFHLEPRKSFAGLASSSMAKFYIFGGYTSGGSENDLWEFDFDQQKWEIKKTLNSPSPRTDMGFVRIFEDNYEIFVIQGGMTLAGPVNEMWR